MTFSDGAKYLGQWKEDIFHGVGTMIFPDGAKHVGQWEDGKAHGYGAIYNPDGSISLEGNFYNDEYIGR